MLCSFKISSCFFLSSLLHLPLFLSKAALSDRSSHDHSKSLVFSHSPDGSPFPKPHDSGIWSSSSIIKPVSNSPVVMVLYNTNDLRVHDHYPLALAAQKASELGDLPVVALLVLDLRNFSYPSWCGGFFRQSPQRAKFLIESIRNLRQNLWDKCQIPLIIRLGSPESVVPLLVKQIGVCDLFLTTQYAPHEKFIHDAIIQSVSRVSLWWSNYSDSPTRNPIISSLEKNVGTHSVWHTTLVHIDDLPCSVYDLRDGERWYHDIVSTTTIRPTEPYNVQSILLKLKKWNSLSLNIIFDKQSTESAQDDSSFSSISSKQSNIDRKLIVNSNISLLHKHENKSMSFLTTNEEEEWIKLFPLDLGAIPTLDDLGYSTLLFSENIFETVTGTETSYPGGETSGLERIDNWLEQNGFESFLRMGRIHRTRTALYSSRLSRLSPYISTGCLSPRYVYEKFKKYTLDNIQDGFVQRRFHEGVLRLSRRDYWHWMGLKYGETFFWPYGPRPEESNDVNSFRFDSKIIQKWCLGLTGIPFADACMKELVTTGFLALPGREAIVWLLTKGYGQDWRIAAEWLERCSLDYDPFICYGSTAYVTGLIKDDFGESVYDIHYLAHHHDQTGIYVKRWIPQLSRVPSVYIHRPHVLTERMQKMHNVIIGENYPFPLKLWDGAQNILGSSQLKSYFKTSTQRRESIGCLESLKFGAGRPDFAYANNNSLFPSKVGDSKCLPTVQPPPIQDFASVKLGLNISVRNSSNQTVKKMNITLDNDTANMTKIASNSFLMVEQDSKIFLSSSISHQDHLNRLIKRFPEFSPFAV